MSGPSIPEPAFGRRPVPLETVLRIHVLQELCNGSDPAMEEVLYEVPLYCRFAGIDLVVDTVPDETTLCRFRYLPERHHLAGRFVDEVNGEFAQRGMALRRGTVVDATLIAAPASTKNKPRKRDGR